MARNTPKARNVDKIIGERLHEMRLHAGWSRAELADKVGITHQQLSKYEKGENRISVGRLELLARAFKVSAGRFFEDIEKQESVPSVNRRMTLEVVRNFSKISNPNHQAIINNLVRELAKQEERPCT